MANDKEAVPNTNDTAPMSEALMDISSLLYPPSPIPGSPELAPPRPRIPVMDPDDFRARYKANDFVLAREARLQNSAVKCDNCKKARKLGFCALDSHYPEGKCLRCKGLRITGCNHENRDSEDYVTQLPPMEMSEEGNKTVVIERRSSRASKGSAKKRARHDEESEVEAPRRPSARIKGRSSKGKVRATRSPIPVPSTKISVPPTLDFDKLSMKSRVRRQAMYYAYTEGVFGEIEEKLEEVRNFIQEVARFEYRLGRREGREAVRRVVEESEEDAELGRRY